MPKQALNIYVRVIFCFPTMLPEHSLALAQGVSSDGKLINLRAPVCSSVVIVPPLCPTIASVSPRAVLGLDSAIARDVGLALALPLVLGHVVAPVVHVKALTLPRNRLRFLMLFFFSLVSFFRFFRNRFAANSGHDCLNGALAHPKHIHMYVCTHACAQVYMFVHVYPEAAAAAVSMYLSWHPLFANHYLQSQAVQN